MTKPQPILEVHDPSPAFPNAVSQAELRWRQVEEFLAVKKFRPNTCKVYARELRRFMRWTDQPWEAVTEQDIARYHQSLEAIDPETKQRQNSTAVVVAALTALKSFFRWRASAELSDNPAATAQLPLQHRPGAQPLTEAEWQCLNKALADRGETQLRDRAIVAVLSHGVTAEEVANLKVADFEEPRLMLRQPHREAQPVMLSQQAIAALTAYLEERRQQRDIDAGADLPLFLSHSLKCSQKGKRLGSDGIYRMLSELGRLSGVEACIPRRLHRHDRICK